MVNGSWDIVIVVLIAVFWVETKGKTLEEIDALFEGHKHSDAPDVEAVRQGKEKIDVDGFEKELGPVVETTNLKVEWLAQGDSQDKDKRSVTC